MKKKLKIICSTALICAAVTGFTACGKWETPYSTLDEQGYTVSVRYDANGGVFAGTNDVYVVDVFNASEKEVSLIEPNDSRRKENAFEITRTHYFLAGWYQTREPRTNNAGEALDDWGNPCSVSGNPQGYIYSDKWDFKNDKLTVDTATSTTSSENTLTLYAAWIPYINYELYAKDPATGAMQQIGEPIQAIDLELPTWNESTGKQDIKKFPKLDGMTFDKAYTDEAMTQQITSSLKGNFDEEHGILAHSGTVKVYTEWLTGEWFHIYNAKQFYTNAKSDGHYVLHADLDFSNQIWKPALSFNAFTGSIIGNGHTVKNVNAVQNTSARDRQEYGGLFGQIAAEAVIKDVTFENVSYTLMEGSLAPQSYFGLLAGAIDDGATLENVTVSGILKIDSKRYPANYTLGLLCGTGTHGNISTENITAVEINGDTETPLTVDPNTGLLILPDAQTQAS